MEVAESRHSGFPILEVRGEVDHAVGDAFMEKAERALGQGNQIALDLSGCPYMDSGGIAVLLSLLRQVRPDGALAVISPNEDLLRIFEIVGLAIDASFHAISSRDELATLTG